MRTSTTFLLFAVIILAFVFFSFFTSRTEREKPYAKAATMFMTAVKNNDIETVKRVTDSKTVEVYTVGKKITAIRFNEVAAYQGAFARSPQVVLPYVVLTDMDIVTKAKPFVLPEENLVYIQMSRKNKIYLRVVDGEWKVFYLTEPGTDIRKDI